MNHYSITLAASMIACLLITQTSFGAVTCSKSGAGVICNNDCNQPEQSTAKLKISVAPSEQVQRMTFNMTSLTNGNGSPTISTLNDQGYTDYHLSETYPLNINSGADGSCTPNWIKISNCQAINITNQVLPVDCYTALNFKFSS